MNKCHADIMLSDAWSLWSNVSWREVDFSKGISSVAVYTGKGREVFNQYSDQMVIMERPYSEYASNSGLKNERKPKNKRPREFGDEVAKNVKKVETIEDIRSDNARITKEIYLEIASLKNINLN